MLSVKSIMGWTGLLLIIGLGAAAYFVPAGLVRKVFVVSVGIVALVWSINELSYDS